jgi:hypothetical protein
VIAMTVSLMPSPTAPAGASAAFEEVFDFYRASGFLYPGKLAALAPRLPAIEQTWRRLLAADPHVFRFVETRAVDGELRNAICAFLYAPGTWQGQHLVSRHRHEYAGTLRVLSQLVQWFHDADVQYARLSFRPSNPGTNRLFGAVPERLPAHLARASIVDYALVSDGAERLGRPRVAVERLAQGDADAAIKFYASILHPVELAALRLDDPELAGVRAPYRAHRLDRSRRLLVAADRNGVIGACLVNQASAGINFSFLENAIEQLRVAPGLPARTRREVWRALAAAALAEARAARSEMAITLDPGDRAAAVEAGLLGPEPKQYAVLTVSRRERGFLRSIGSFNDYYRALRRQR